ncbi:MAG: lipoate--protein ligase family protein [Planctomycetota bacterium]|nr:lipoate--protein ligase family protein [Planctomycetota bacterium]
MGGNGSAAARAFSWTSPSGPVADIGIEEAILLAVNDGRSPPAIRFWSPVSPAVVIGTGQAARREVNVEEARRAGVPVVRRFSGGGAVIIGPGVWNYSVFLKYEMVPGSETIAGAAGAVIGWAASALGRLGICAFPAGVSDLAVNVGGRPRKLAGHAQARKRRAFCLHGSILADPDIGLIERLLPMPSEVPAYRDGRGHGEFLTSLASLGARFGMDGFAEAFLAASGLCVERMGGPAAAEIATGSELAASKYSSEAWTFRR